ncbi:MAG: glycosyltransferase family 2 protein [Clostridia bacterium]|nr:glycosyltransferase family 2 protein [Clostridia bacterium]
MKDFEILCVTMNQTDFSKIGEMNIHSDVVFANQTDFVKYEETVFDGKHTARMISTNTVGVGINRNISLAYADADICLLADDDVVYYDGMEQKISDEFKSHPEADIFIFNFDTLGTERKQKVYSKTRKCSFFERMPWGGIRIAFRLNSIKKANLFFNTLFGGGCIFPSGEDSVFLITAKRAGLKFYVSKETIGKVSMENSSWYTGADEKFFYGKGAFYAAIHNRTFLIWLLYFLYRTRKDNKLSLKEKIHWMNCGKKGFRKMISYDEYSANI